MRRAQPKPTKGAEELLKELKHHGVLMQIVTSSSRELIIQDLDILSMTNYFAEIYGQDETGYHKPDPRVLHIVIRDLKRLGHEIVDAVFIGDSVRDYRVASGNQIEFIAVLSGLETRQDFLDAGVAPSRIIATLSELLSSD